MDRQKRKLRKPAAKGQATSDSPGRQEAPGGRLEWKEPEGHWVWVPIGVAVCLGLGAGFAFLCVSAAKWAWGKGDWFSLVFSVILLGGFAILFIGASIDLAFFRRHAVLDKGLGTYRAATYFAGFCVKELVSSIHNVDAVGIKPFLTNKNRIKYLLQLEKCEGEPIDVGKFSDEKDLNARAAELGDFLGVGVEYAKLTPSEAAREYRFVSRIFLVMYVLSALFFGSFAIGTVVPLVRNAWVLDRYRESELVQVPCRILSFEVHRPKKGDSIHAVDGGVKVHITEGTMAHVRFEYEYEGERYESTKYAPLGDSAPDDVTAHPPGHETVCYVNPRWPGGAVLSTEVRAKPIFLVGIVILVAMPFFIGISFSMQRSFRKLYLIDMGWPDELPVTDEVQTLSLAPRRRGRKPRGRRATQRRQ